MLRQLLPFLLFITLVFVPLLSAEEVSTSEQSEQISEPKAPTFIELSDIPSKAAETSVEIKEITEELRESDEIKEIGAVLPSYISSIDALLNEPVYTKIEQQNVRELQKLRQQWKIYNSELKKWAELVNSRVTVYDLGRDKLQTYSSLWSETHINATNVSAPPAIQEHITNVIIKIEELRNHAKTNYDKLLTASNLITTRMSAINEKLKAIDEAEVLLSTQIFQQTQPSLFQAIAETSFSPLVYAEGIFTNLSEKFNEFVIYNKTHPKEQMVMVIGSLMIIIFVAYFNYLFRKKTLFVSKASLHRSEYYFIGLPFSTALILIVLLSVVAFTDAPKSLREILLYLIMIPTLRIMMTVIKKGVMPYFYSYFLLYFISLMEKNALTYNLDDRFLNILISVSLIVLIIKFIQNKATAFVATGIIKTIVYRSLPLVVLLLVFSILANVYGAVLLSEKIAHGVFTAIHSSIIFFVLTIILSGYVVIMLRRRISSASNILEKYATKIEGTTTLVIKIFMILWWFRVLIKILGLDAKLNELIDTIMELAWIVGSTTISVQSIVSFIMILVGTWLLARFVNIVLEVEVFSRFKLSRGMPTAISTVLNYIIVISGLLIALSSLGVSTEQFALVFGALGVGIGFGLRNIIANFVSGIIMVFERPIQIGDTIEVDNTMGKVMSIGTRASAVQTFDGSEVIVPNERFISSKIINWTLSDERRRKVLQIKVAFDSDIETVLEIMRSVALANKDVLKDPEPLPTFQGFGDYYLEFKLYYWLTENLIVAQSDIAIAVYKRLKEENIATPMPIQELVMPKEK